MSNDGFASPSQFASISTLTALVGIYIEGNQLTQIPTDLLTHFTSLNYLYGAFGCRCPSHVHRTLANNQIASVGSAAFGNTMTNLILV